jgi:hypothetical protein
MSKVGAFEDFRMHQKSVLNNNDSRKHKNDSVGSPAENSPKAMKHVVGLICFDGRGAKAPE